MYVKKKIVSTERTPYMCVWNTLITLWCAVCSAFTGNFCWLCQVIHKQWSYVHATLKTRKNRSKVALRACKTQLRFENVLRILNFLTLCFSEECTVKIPRGNYLDRELPELVPPRREMLQTTLSRSFLTAKMRIMTLKLKDPQWQHWSHFCWYARHCWSPTYNGLILCYQTHVHAVENTNVDVGDSERCEKFDFFENRGWENSWLQKFKSGFRRNLSLLFDFCFCMSCVLIAIFYVRAVKQRKIHFWLRGEVASPVVLKGLRCNRQHKCGSRLYLIVIPSNREISTFRLYKFAPKLMSTGL